MRGTFLSISSFAFLIAAGVLVIVGAGLQPGGDGTNRGARSDDGSRLALVTRGSGQRDQDLKLLLALKVLGREAAARRNDAAHKDHPHDSGADNSERPGS